MRRNGRHDAAEHRRSKRSGRERGVWVYVPAEVLEAAGFDADADPPLYRTWAARSGRGSVQLRLYKP